MINSNELVLKPINDLLNESFFIPAYQRGYRWSQRQVIELLDDIKEFQQKAEDSHKSAFYCLQPIVVKQHNGGWELVDGQQRLTTIYIILTYLKDILTILGKPRYKLSYETRESSAEFLQHIDEERAGENIDFFHISEAKKAVDEWFKAQDGTYQIKFIQTLLNDDDTGKNVKVIWYQISDTENVTEVFTRLNMGKIPLVNAELVKALFLKSSNFAKNIRDINSKKPIQDLQQLKISQEWDSIEKRLQDDAFWYFISNRKITSNRIEFVLSLAARNLDCEGIIETDKLKIFLQFNQLFNSSNNSDLTHDVANEWLKIKQCFMTLEEWYNDRALFHLIGYLISQNVSISELFDLNQNASTKYAFRTELLKRAFNKTFNGIDFDEISIKWFEETLSTLTYDSGPHKLRPVLLLFNVASLLANPTTNARFQFDKYKLDSWDIEHIRSVASDMPNTKDKQKIWLENVISYISEDKQTGLDSSSDINNEEQEIRTETQALLNASIFDNDQFELLYDKVRVHYDPDSDEDVNNSIGNLTLLDSSTNRSYQNAVFPIKRSRIIALDKKATFVPLCTKNAFLKYYSKQVDKMLYWETGDSEDHQQAMIEMLFGFFNGVGVHNKEYGYE